MFYFLSLCILFSLFLLYRTFHLLWQFLCPCPATGVHSCRTTPDILSYWYAGCHSTWSATQLSSDRVNSKSFPARIVSISQSSESTFPLQRTVLLDVKYIYSNFCVKCAENVYIRLVIAKKSGAFTQFWTQFALVTLTSPGSKGRVTHGPPRVLLYHVPCVLEHASFRSSAVLDMCDSALSITKYTTGS